MVRGTAHGFGDWAWQRATAAIMAIYSIALVARLLISPPVAGAEGWKLWMSNPPFKWLTLLFLLALIYHAQLGVKEILMDYVHDKKIRASLQNLFTAALIAYAVWSVVIVWSIQVAK